MKIRALLLATALLTTLFTGTAQAAQGDLACTGNFQFNFSPALTATTTTATADVGGGLVDCFSANGTYSRLKSGVRTGVGTVSRPLGLAPCAPVMTITEGAVLTWNTGETSTFDITVNTDPTSGALTISAYFTSGPLAGDTANAYPIILHPNLDCGLHGLTQLTSDLLEVFWA
ncbi:hypothetical protein [Actinokineospora sp. HUAS TT18]|uniref:hypothetical protein n=1 Tax=Actinokineospora sp. HUAS TT18 TaxID=3447451 RepID=UPI003F520754